MIMARAADLLTGSVMTLLFLGRDIGALVGVLESPAAYVIKKWIGKVPCKYGLRMALAIIIIKPRRICRPDGAPFIAGRRDGVFSALDLVIAMPISWLPLRGRLQQILRKRVGALLWGNLHRFTDNQHPVIFGGCCSEPMT